LSSSPTDLTFEKPPPQVVFSFTGQKITHCSKRSQEVLHLNELSTTIFRLYFPRIFPKNIFFTLCNRMSHALKKGL
ncbi:hypothetical protein DS395_23625, partial [Salmonella enterica subsp. enterica serovar Cerro]|nr:hypothetical protein [Salmonella enterica subsp. enterica serovar Cerro]EBH9565162.1 hypothetical protein [Salmonella enterica subsp. enterica serovar Cerro]EBK7563606.1 hypothetical protein [Salmonella enterica subsp. enterica serovar Cerro]EBS9479646.1 hypothetical protein [Salmonella enterica subsp. enterica serovar Cerro]ECC2174731.1 hypothetical protein [Salmonella enterica subsp. enterica serovar Cerro]